MVLYAGNVLGFEVFKKFDVSHPIVATLAGDNHLFTKEANDAGTGSTGLREGVERVYLNPDATMSFDCPKSVCGVEFYFGRGNSPVNMDTKDQPASASGSPVHRNVEGVPVQATPQLLKDLTIETDMTYLGIDRNAHYLSFLKNSICGELYKSPSHLPPAKPDLACTISNLDANSIYMKRMESYRLHMGPGVAFVINMTSNFALSARERAWKRNLSRSTSLRFLIFFAQTFGMLKPNILKTNPGTIVNKILLKRKDLFYPLTELCLYIKACETTESYPERLFQGFPLHVHPNDPSYLDLPIFSHLRKFGADVAFPREAPILFQPRIYDGNISVDRKVKTPKTTVLDRTAELIERLKWRGHPTASSGSDSPPNANEDNIGAGMSESGRDGARVPKDTEAEEARREGKRGQMPSGRHPESTLEQWKKQTYQTWHNLWTLNVLAYHAANEWGWLQYHKASTFAFPPWRVSHVGVLLTTEAAPMRWHDLSPRFRVEPINASKSATEEKQDAMHAKPIGIYTPLSSPDLTAKPGRLVDDLSSSLPLNFDSPVLNGGDNTSSDRQTLLAPTKEVPQRTASLAEHRAAVQTVSPGETQSEDTVHELLPNSTRIGATSGSTRTAGQASSSKGKDSDVPLLPEGCPPHLTDMLFFKKLGLPYGRLITLGPSGASNTVAHNESALRTEEPGTWRPDVIGAEVKCPPVVHPDTCGLTASFNRKYAAPWIWILERDESQMPKDKDDSLEYADVVWLFRGTFVSKLWLVNGMGIAVPYKVLSKRGRFHYGIVYLFEKAVRPTVEQELRRLQQRIAGRKTPYVIVFTGHSLGGAIAQLSAWYFAKRAKTLMKKGLVQIRTVAFGCPTWGDTKTYEDLLASGVKPQELNMDIDPVGSLFGEEALTKLSNSKPFLIQLYVEDMDKVEVASSVPGAPPFSGRIWTRPTYRPIPLVKRLAAMMFDLEDVDMMLLDPLRAHYMAYTAAFTIMAGLLEQASFGSGVAAPFVSNIKHFVGHTWNVALKAAHKTMEEVLHRVEADRLTE